jgi:copper chaperone CopZ
MKKTIMIILTGLILGLLACNKGEAKQANIALTTMQCGMCESTIEKGIAKVNGITTFDVDMAGKSGHVTYNASIIDLASIEKAVSALGYQANETIADPVAYEALPGCCKVGGM